MRNEFLLFSLAFIAGFIGLGLTVHMGFLWALLILSPIFIIGFWDYFLSKKSIKRNFPILGRGRYLMEELRPKIYQYFIESDTNGTPVPRIFRSVVYQRSKKSLDTAPFGTQLQVYDEGYEWMNHSINPVQEKDIDHDPRVLIGGPDCAQPYSASLLNVGAMSYGSLSSNAIAALNGGAKIAGFAHNTGEGGISPYHLQFGGDLIYQIGTGYFGSRAADGKFDPVKFNEQMAQPSVKMAELKLSQGAKPGHGGILPAKKVTPEIAAIRGIEMGKDVLSPPFHYAFNTPRGLCETIQTMRVNAHGKPVGFKLCVGQWDEFFGICKAMIETGIKPDFIAVDGGEGGTGAAPLEFTNRVGTPYRDGLAFVDNALRGFGLRDDITLIASGKILTAFHMYRAFALGADVCYSARGMMLALGCIQALECNTNHCPTGVATQKKELVRGLVVTDKKERVANYHKETIHAFVELLSASGLRSHKEIERYMINRRVFMNKVNTYEDIYPAVEDGCMLQESTVPEVYLSNWKRANTDKF